MLLILRLFLHSRMANQTSLLRSALLSVNCCRYNSNTAALTRIKRSKYPRLYPTRIVNPDGSTYTIRYEMPRQIICVCSFSSYIFVKYMNGLDFLTLHTHMYHLKVMKKPVWVSIGYQIKFYLGQIRYRSHIELPEDTKNSKYSWSDWLTQIFWINVCVYKITKFSRVIVFINIFSLLYPFR